MSRYINSFFLLFLTLLIVCCSPRASAKISEKSLSHYKSAFLTMLIEENPEYERQIRTYMDGMVMEGRKGIPLLDKFGLFLDYMEKNGVSINRIRFYSHDGRFCMFIVMKDENDEQLYTVFIEYEYDADARCVLKDIYFSIVFEERMKELKSFFETR
jgi:hypothetical protein